jgi:hypothetical protein
MFAKRFLAVGVSVFSIACGEVCDDNVDNNKNELIDCAEAEQCGEDPACAVAATAESGAVRGGEADFAAGSVAFEFATVNLGVDAAVFVAVASDQPDSCALILDNLGVTDGKIIVFVAADGGEPDPALAFTAGATFVGDGQFTLAGANMQIIAGGALVANANSEQAGSITFDKIGADNFVSASFNDQLTQDLTVEADFDTDANADGINDFLAITPVSLTANFTNASNCPGLANEILGL